MPKLPVTVHYLLPVLVYFHHIAPVSFSLSVSLGG